MPARRRDVLLALRAFPAAAAGSSAYVIAVDGGLIHARKLGLQPDAWVGDLDSLPKREHARALAMPSLLLAQEKDLSDLEVALRVATKAFRERRCHKHLILLGFQGGRLDHELINITTVREWLRKFAVKKGVGPAPCVVFAGPRGILAAAISTLRFRTKLGQLFSVFSFEGRLAPAIRGARYPAQRKLDRAPVEPFKFVSQGLSNVATGREVTLDAGPGRKDPVFVAIP